MAIQFQCGGCQQPIEVDDQFANRQAVCPFCRAVVVVPPQTSLGVPPGDPSIRMPDEAGGVTPPGGAPPPLPPVPPPTAPSGGWDRANVPPHAPPRPPPTWEPPPGYGTPGYPPPGYGGYGRDPRQDPARAAALAYGNYAIVCFIIATALLAISVVLATTVLFSEVAKVVGPGTTQPSPEEVARVQAAFVKAAQNNSWIAACGVGTSFFGLIGFVLAIVSLMKSTDNWRGWVSVVGCGVYTICCCGSLVLSAAGAASS